MRNNRGLQKFIGDRPPGLVAIVAYKVVVALFLAVTSITLLLTLVNYQNLIDFSEVYLLESKERLINWLLEKVLDLQPKTLRFSGIAAGVYAALTMVEAIGLWYEKAWASILVVGLVGISIPLEIYELIRGISLVKLVVFCVNVAVLWYLIRHFSEHSRSR